MGDVCVAANVHEAMLAIGLPVPVGALADKSLELGAVEFFAAGGVDLVGDVEGDPDDPGRGFGAVHRLTGDFGREHAPVAALQADGAVVGVAPANGVGSGAGVAAPVDAVFEDAGQTQPGDLVLGAVHDLGKAPVAEVHPVAAGQHEGRAGVVEQGLAGFGREVVGFGLAVGAGVVPMLQHVQTEGEECDGHQP